MVVKNLENVIPLLTILKEDPLNDENEDDNKIRDIKKRIKLLPFDLWFYNKKNIPMNTKQLIYTISKTDDVKVIATTKIILRKLLKMFNFIYF